MTLVADYYRFSRANSYSRRFNGRGSLALLTAFVLGAVSSCGTIVGTSAAPPGSATATSSVTISGSVSGGQQAIAGASIQVYATGMTGDKSAATALLTAPVKTDSAGSFTINTLQSCPSVGSEVYMVTTGGSPVDLGGSANPNASLMTLLATCESLASQSSIRVNEVTTIASVYALAAYMGGAASVGFAEEDAQQFANNLKLASELADLPAGTSPGNVPAGEAAPVDKLNTLANIVSSCVDSHGGAAGDGSACGDLFQYAGAGSSAKDTVAAILAIATNPADNVDALYALSTASSAYQPALPSAPADWALTMIQAPASPTFSPIPGSYTGVQTITIADSSPGAVLHYTTDGSTPTVSSTEYSGAISVSASATIRAIALTAGLASPIASAAYAISSPPVPVFSPAPGLYNAPESVSLSDGDPSATIYYTTDGSLPSPSSSRYEGAIDLSSSATIQAIAFDGGLSSPVAAGQFEVTAPRGVTFSLAGLISPATVSESVFVYASGLGGASSVSYLIDGRAVTSESVAPYWMGGQSNGTPHGFPILSAGIGAHILSAVATFPDGSQAMSNDISLNVVPSINATLGGTLTPYPNEISAQLNSTSTTLANVTTPRAFLTPQEIQTRTQVLAMYMNWGIDPSLDYTNDESSVLAGLAPRSWQKASPMTAGEDLSSVFSSDAPAYQPIPAAWPRVLLPSGYFQNAQLNTTVAGDGLGYGEVTASPTDPQLPVRSEWYSVVSTLVSFSFPMPSDWYLSLPGQPAGDSHMIFADPQSQTFVSSYKTTVDPVTGGPDALYASLPTPFNSLGDKGGSTAATFAELPFLIQPGESTNPQKPIGHAIGGAIGRTWAARVYPASGRDANVLTSTNSCTGTGYTNTGLIPYGGVIQLDPQVDLTTLGLSLPALRILQAMQTYGYYVMDFGCADIDIYTSISEAELDPYEGLWAYNKKGPGVQNEIQSVLSANKIYVVVPLTKKQ